MKHHKLRMAWSVAWAIVAVLAVVMWQRSYALVEAIRLPYTSSHILQILSIPGRVAIGNVAARQGQTSIYRVAVDEWHGMLERTGTPASSLPSPLIGGWVQNKRLTQIFFPYWLVTVASAYAAVAMWLPFHFGLRALFITMTSVAIWLGLTAWLHVSV